MTSDELAKLAARAKALEPLSPADEAAFASLLVPIDARLDALELPPSKFTSQDIGAVTPAGTTSEVDGRITIRVAGADIWGSADAFRFHWVKFTGDGSVTVRIESLARTDNWAKAGAMIRASLAPNSAYAYSLFAAQASVALQTRRTTSGQGNHLGDRSRSVPVWVRLTRTGNLFTAASSTDGATWQTISADTIVMPAEVYGGLAVTAHNAGSQTTAMASGLAVVALAEKAPVITSPLTVTGTVGAPLTYQIKTA